MLQVERARVWCLLIAGIAFGLDQLHKYWMLHIFDIAQKGRVEISSFFDLVLVWNRGVSYGLFSSNGETTRIILIVLTFLAVAAILIWMFRTSSNFTALALAFIAGGAAGNLADRIIYGAVADFFSFHAFGFNWYVFNLADTAIVVGVAGLIYESLFIRHKSAANDQ
ncbi:MAG: signal peptidase II [Rhizobiales bacterium]|nr:signal peptidase II [Hyphomicrobiales bacterium]